VIINCAAYTTVDAAETNRDLAFAVNAVAVGEMADAARHIGARFVTISTDYVFDGSSPDPYVESSETNPVNVYGASKLAGERSAFEVNAESLIIRTSWVLSGTHPNFVATMIRMARERSFAVVDDQMGHPTLVPDLADAIIAAVESEVTGVLHLTNSGVTTWYQLAREAVVLAGIDPDVISPCTTADYPTPARRPINSVLHSERLVAEGLDPMPPYAEGLGALVGDLEANGIV
jgi:dTDP-4-dehydrorhamnose reductase